MAKSLNCSAKVLDGANRFRFQNFGERMAKISFDTINKSCGKYDQPPVDGSSWFEQALGELRESNLTADFTMMASELLPLSGGLPQLLFYRGQIVDILMKYFGKEDSLAHPAVSRLAAMLAKDLGSQFYQYFAAIFGALLTALFTSSDPEAVEALLGTALYLLRAQSRQMLADLSSTYVLFEPALIAKNKQQQCHFAAQCFAFVLRKCKDIDAALYILTDCVSKSDKPEAHKGLAMVLSEVVSNGDQPHSCAKMILGSILKLVPDNAAAALIFRHLSLKYLCKFAKEQAENLWTCFLSIFQKSSESACYGSLLDTLAQMLLIREGTRVSRHADFLDSLIVFLSGSTDRKLVYAALECVAYLFKSMGGASPAHINLWISKSISVLPVDEAHEAAVFFLATLCVIGLEEVGRFIPQWARRALKSPDCRISGILLRAGSIESARSLRSDLTSWPADMSTAHLSDAEMLLHLQTTVGFGDSLTIGRLLSIFANMAPESLVRPVDVAICTCAVGLASEKDMMNNVLLILKQHHGHPSIFKACGKTLKCSGGELPVDRFDTISSIATGNLLSADHELRSSALELLLHSGAPSLANVTTICCSVEYPPITFETFRAKILDIKKFEELLQSPMEDAVFSTAIHYLFGLTRIKMTLIWPEVYRVLGKFAAFKPEKFAEFLEFIVRSISKEATEEFYDLPGVPEELLPHVTAPKTNDLDDHSLAELPCLQKTVLWVMEHSEAESYLPLVLENVLGRQPCYSIVNSSALLSVTSFLAANQTVLDKHSRLIVNLFLTVFDRKTSYLDFPLSSSFIKQCQSNLATLLGLLSRLGSLPRIDHADVLESIITEFLTFDDSSIQALSLEILFQFRKRVLGTLKDRLLNLLDDKSMRDELTKMTLERDLLSATEGWHDVIVPVLCRIFYGRMIARKGFNSNSDTIRRRRAIFGYMSSWDAQALKQFINMILAPFEIRQPDHNGRLGVRDVTMAKQMGFLNILDEILKCFAKKMAADEMDRICKCLFAISNLPEVDINGDAEEKRDSRKIRQLSMKRILQLFQECPSTFDMSLHYQHMFSAVISPRIALLDSESTQTSSSLIDLFLLWSTDSHYFDLIHCYDERLWPKLIGCFESELLASDVLAKLISLLEKVTLKCETNEKLAEKLLLPNLARIIGAIGKRLQQMEIASRGSSSDLFARLITLLVSFSSFITSEMSAHNLCEFLLKALEAKSVTENVKMDMLKILSRFMPLMTELAGDLLYSDDMYSVVSLMWASLKTGKARATLAGLFMALAKDRGDLQPIALALGELDSMTVGKVEEADYDRRLAALSRLRQMARELPYPLWIPVLHAMIYCLHDPEEMSIRNQAATVVSLFIESASSDERLYSLIPRLVYPAIKKAMKSPHDVIRQEFVLILNLLTSKFTMSPFGELKPLLASGDEEANVFLNIFHLQLHRKSRAIHRLGDFFKHLDNTASTKVLFQDIFLPLLSHYVLFNQTRQQKSIPPLLTAEAIAALGILFGKLSWRSYIAKLIIFIEMVEKTAVGEKNGIKLIISILGSFHFDMSKDQRVRDKVLQQLLPKLFGLLVDKKNSTEIVRAPIALAIAHILRRLENEKLVIHLPKLFTSLCHALRSRREDVRDDVRATLVKIIGLLGSDYLQFVVQELEATLMRGYQFHVMVYTLHAILVELVKTVRPGDVDCCLDKIMTILKADIFGSQAKDKKASEWTGKIKEVKIDKSFEALELVTRLASVEYLPQLIVHIRESAMATSDGQTVEKALKGIGKGILSRDWSEAASIQQALTFIYFLFNPISVGPEENASTELSLHVHRFQGLGLDVLSYLLKHLLISRSNAEHVRMLDPLVPIINEFLQAKHTLLVQAALKTFVLFLEYPLPSIDTALLDQMVLHLFKLIVQINSGLHVDLIQAVLKLLSVIIRNYSEVTISAGQFKALIEYVKTNMDRVDHHILTFSLVKSILARKAMLPEVYELMDLTSKMLVTSMSAETRQQCRTTFLKFLLDYPLGPARLAEYLNFLITNLQYEISSGRESVTIFIEALISKFPDDIVSEYSDTLIVAIALRMANEDSELVQSRLDTLIKTLIRRIGGKKRDNLLMLLERWSNDEKTMVQISAFRIYQSAMDVMRTAFDASLPGLLNSMDESLRKRMQEPEDVSKIQSVILTTLMWLVREMSESLNKVGAQLRPLFDTLFMLFPSLHPATSQLANELLGHYFSGIDITSWKSINGGFSPIIQLADLNQLCSTWCDQLEGFDDQTELVFSEQIVKNLLFAMRVLYLHTYLIISGDKEGKPAVIWTAKRLEFIVRKSPVKAIVHASSVLKIFAGLVMTSSLENDQSVMSDEILRSIISVGFRISNDQASFTNEDLRAMSLQVLDLLQAKLGADRYLPIYQAVRERILATRAARRELRKQLPVLNPEAHATRRITRNLAKREKRKRKPDLYCSNNKNVRGLRLEKTY